MTRLTTPGASAERPSRRVSPWRGGSEYWWRQYGLKTQQHCLAPATAGQETSFQACAIGPPQTSNMRRWDSAPRAKARRLQPISLLIAAWTRQWVARTLAKATSVLAS